MVGCAKCGRPFDPGASSVTLRSDRGRFHLPCAPTDLLESAVEEYGAILRKGVRYFVEKYSASPSTPAEIGPRFLELGQAVESERARRALPGSATNAPK